MIARWTPQAIPKARRTAHTAIAASTETRHRRLEEQGSNPGGDIDHPGRSGEFLTIAERSHRRHPGINSMVERSIQPFAAPEPGTTAINSVES